MPEMTGDYARLPEIARSFGREEAALPWERWGEMGRDAEIWDDMGRSYLPQEEAA